MMVPSNNNREFYTNQGMDWHDPSTDRPQFEQPTGDLLGFDAPSPMPHHHQQQHHQQQHQPLLPHTPPRLQQQQQVFNATQATISITTTSTSAAPAIAGLGKIAPSAPRNATIDEQTKPKRKVIYVPTYSCNGGLDTKVSCD
jgi:hypothetical protein